MALLCQTLLKALEEIFYKNRRGVLLQEFLVISKPIGSMMKYETCHLLQLSLDLSRFLPFFGSNRGHFRYIYRLKVQI